MVNNLQQVGETCNRLSKCDKKAKQRYNKYKTGGHRRNAKKNSFG